MITIITVIIVCKSHMRWSYCDHDDKLLRSQRQVLDNWKLKDLKTEASASLREDSLLRARDLRGSEYAEQDSYHITIHFMSSPMSLSFEILYAVFKCIWREEIHTIFRKQHAPLKEAVLLKNVQYCRPWKGQRFRSKWYSMPFKENEEPLQIRSITLQSQKQFSLTISGVLNGHVYVKAFLEELRILCKYVAFLHRKSAFFKRGGFRSNDALLFDTNVFF